MAGLGHLGFGFASKAIAPRVNVLVLLLASELIDVLWGFFYITGLERFNSSPLSHSFIMALIWALCSSLIAALIYHDSRSGIVVGILVFGHWVVDFITHPMGAISGGTSLPPDLPLGINGSSKVGLGLYNHSFTIALISDIGMLLTGLLIFVYFRKSKIRQTKSF
jgi:hypothetical protein